MLLNGVKAGGSNPSLSIQLIRYDEPPNTFGSVTQTYRQAPVVHRHHPFFRDILYYQKHQFHKSLLRTKCTFGFRDFTDLTEHSFNWIRSINGLRTE